MIRLPFVSRGIYDDARADLASATEELRKLTQVIIDMKVTGATIRQATSTTMGVKLDRKPLSKIDKALDTNPRTRQNLALRTRYKEWAERMLEGGTMSEDEIEERLLTWNQVARDDDDDAEESVL